MESTADSIFQKYKSAYGSNVQGCCPLIADEIVKSVGGDVVAGELLWYGGSCRRTHWWVEKDGVVLDPMGDEFLSTEIGTNRIEIHRDRYVFDQILGNYEQWRVCDVSSPHPKLSQPESNCPKSLTDPYDTIEQQDFIQKGK